MSMRSHAKYWSVFTITFMQGLKNYKYLFGLSFFLITCLIIFSHLWKLVAIRKGVIGFSPDTLLWYIAFNEWVLISVPDIHFEMERDLKSGTLAYMLPRPISYLGTKFVEGSATLTLQLLILGIVTFFFATIWTENLPLTFPHFCVMVLLGFGAGILALIFQMIVGLTSFWLNDVAPFSWVWEKLLFVFGGLILPITVYPELLQKIAVWTPFPVVLGGRSGLIFNFNIEEVSILFASLILWITVGVCSLRFLYCRGLKILNIQGG